MLAEAELELAAIVLEIAKVLALVLEKLIPTIAKRLLLLRTPKSFGKQKDGFSLTLGEDECLTEHSLCNDLPLLPYTLGGVV